MVGITDLEKIKLSIKRVVSTAWWHKRKELEEFEFHEDKVKYFLDKYPNPKIAIQEAYYWGRQQGRLTVAKQIMAAIGEPVEDE